MAPATRRLVLPLAIAACSAAAIPGSALGAKGDLDLVSRADGPAGAPAGDGSDEPSISADGARVAFESQADNLSLEDNDQFQSVFVRDVAAGTTTLVSRASGATGAPADDRSEVRGGMSDDGRRVAFMSYATNLSTDNRYAKAKIFVRDLATHTTTLVSRASGANGEPGDQESFNPSISGDGRHVAFMSWSENLSADALGGLLNIYVRDLVANTTTLVSRNSTGAGADGNSFNPSVSADGRRIAFESDADNLSTVDDDGSTNIFVHDIATGTTTLVNRATGAAGAAGGANASSPGISPSGRYVVFHSLAGNLSPDDRNTTDVFLRDLDRRTTTLVSRADGAAGAGGDGASFGASVSDDGRVTFVSAANNLSVQDVNSVQNVFLRDTRAGTTELVSRGRGAGPAANQRSLAPAISGGGRYVAFASDATNLIAGAPPVRHVYRRDTRGGDASATAPGCKALPPPPATSAGGTATFTLSAGQLLINQRIGQAAIRRLNAVEARLGGGLQARDLCGHTVAPDRLGPGITSVLESASLAPAAIADPAPIEDPGRKGAGDEVTLSAAQLLINQRIYQAAIRRADGIAARLDGGLSGGDIAAGAVTQGKLADRLRIVSASPTPEPAATTTVIPPRKRPPDPGSVVLSVGQLKINQRVAQAGVRDANALIRRLEGGVQGTGLRPGTLTAADLG
jgi:Tol biopolymer transport system component